MSYNSNNVEHGDLCDSTSDSPLSKLLMQYSKESRAYETKEKEFQEQEENAEVEKKESELALFGSNMWHSMGAASMKTDSLKGLNDDIGQIGSINELLSALRSDDKETVSRTFLAMSSSSECCVTIRQSSYLPVLVGLIHDEGSSKTVCEQASKALHNIVLNGAENKQGRREAMVYKLIEQLLKYCELRENASKNTPNTPNIVPEIANEVPLVTPTVSLLMKFSFNEEYRHAMCEFGALHTLAKLIETDHRVHNGDVQNLPAESVSVRRYAAMALTNLTFRDSNNKVLLCSFKLFMRVLVAQLQSSNEDLCQVTASVLRNLSWRADSYIKKVLRDIDAVTSLMKTALRVQKESTLKAVLSALWNLSAHSNLNKADICTVDGAIEYLVKMLNYQAPSGTLVIVENVGGILRNISSSIAVQDDYRAIIRKYNCLHVLLHQLTSPSLTVVSNACGTLWNLSARCAEDQSTLISLGAIDMLRSLVHSKHKMISVACSAAIKNLTNARLDANVVADDSRGVSGSDSAFLARKRRVLELEIGARLRESGERLSQSDLPSGYEVVGHEYNFGDGKSLLGRQIVNYAAHPLRSNSNIETMSTMTRGDPSSMCFNFASDKNDKDAQKNTNNENQSTIAICNPTNTNPSIRLPNDETAKSPKNGYSVYHQRDNSSSSCNSDEDLHSSKTNGFRKCEEPYNVDDSFSNYAETDLDQPTNYSLRFHEQSRSDMEHNEMMNAGLVDECNDARAADASITTSTIPTISADQKTAMASGPSCIETPLVFSRSSSLGSVSNCSQGTGDDHGSIVSDFSHGVSGVISPSDLPASPSETMPSSPRSALKNTTTVKPLPVPLPPPTLPVAGCSVFEDSVKVFKDENTPIHFSVATSLSSLTFDDDVPMLASAEAAHLPDSSPSPSCQQILADQLGPTHPPAAAHAGIASSLSVECVTQPVTIDHDDEEEKEDCLDLDLSPEEEEAVLNACIDRGMPTLHHKFMPVTGGELAPNFMISSRSVNIAPPVAIGDSTINFCTEDTPISISHAASNSDLSLLCPSEDSFLQNSILPLSSCVDDHDILDELPDEEQEKLLNLCIAAGQSLSFGCNKSTKKCGAVNKNNNNTENSNKSLDEGRSSQSSTLSEVTEDLPVEEEEHTLLKDMTESANLVNTCSSADNEYSLSHEVDDKELSEEESENLLNQCIALGMRSMKDSTDRTKDFSDLENVGPPSFLAEANLDSSLTNVEEITDYPPCKHEKSTPKQRRHQLKDRYNTYTVKLSPTKLSETPFSDGVKNLPPTCKDRRTVEKDRFKTRTLSKGDFEEIVKSQENRSPKSPQRITGVDETSTPSDDEDCQDKTKDTKPAGRAKSGIPVVRSKLPAPKSAGCVKAMPPNELPIVGLQRQNTFTKDEPSSIPVRKNSFKNNNNINNNNSSSNSVNTKSSTPTDALSSQFRSGIPSRIKEPSPRVGGRILNGVMDKSPDFAKSRWSASENNLNSSVGVLKTTSNSSLNTSLNGNNSPVSNASFTCKLSPSASQSALPVRRESSSRSSINSATFRK